jgi:L-iduronidase
MGNVSGYFTDFTNGTQARAWVRLVHALAEHLIDRYGQAEVQGWLFETWNEPDVGFWTQGDEAFCAYYDACAAGLQSADPGLRLGGPGTCRNLSPTLKAFLAHCDTGTSAVTGGPATRPAFISIHEKGVRSHQEDLTPDSMGIVEREARVIDYIREHHPVLTALPFMNNECDPQVGWGTIHTWRARPYYAALVAKIINQHLLELIDGKGVDYALLSNDNGFMGTWGHRTLLTRFSESDHIDHGQADGHRDAPRLEADPLRRKAELIKKPVLNAMTLLSLLGDERCPVVGVGSPAESVGAIATRRGISQVAVLLYNSADRINAGGSDHVTLKLEGLPFEKAALCIYRIDEADPDPFAVWEQMGAPNVPTADEFARMRERQELRATEAPREVNIRAGSLALDLTIALPSLALVLLTADSGIRPERVAELRAEHYEGLTGATEVLLTWTGVGSRALRTYEILGAPSIEGPAERINTVDLLDTAFLHTSAGVDRVYWVRAVDYWNRGGDLSDPVHIEH